MNMKNESNAFTHLRKANLIRHCSDVKGKTGFTLAETMIVIVVLGIIATLTIPALVNKNKESVAKTKVRKAMAAYESALNKMIIENDLKDNTPLITWAGNAGNNCANSTNYFKKIQGDGCIFKTSDGIWWNISDIERPVISFKEINAGNEEQITTNANNANDKTAFVLVGRFGTDGSLRVDDLAYETANSIEDAHGNESKAQVEKLYSLLRMKRANISKSDESVSIFSNCDFNQLTCTIDDIAYTRGTIADKTEIYCTYDDLIDYDNENCENESNATAGKYWTINLGKNISWSNAQTACPKGTRLPTMAELRSLSDNGNLKCQDGSVYCDVWVVEEITPSDAFSIPVNYRDFWDDAYNSYDKDYSGDVELLCIGQ